MLVFLRKASQTIFAKLLLLLLVVSFGVWGVSASLFSTQSDTVVAVGDQSVSMSDFAFAYQRNLSEMSQRFGTQLTTEQARSLGVENQVYAQLAAGAALDQLAVDMNLGLSEDRLAQLIGEDPAFINAAGNFDKSLFVSRLRNAGLREEDYINERSRVAVRSQIVDATSEGFAAPKVLLDAIRDHRFENRDLDYLVLTNGQIDPISPPTEDVLKTWFEAAKARYRAPEYRSFSYVKLEPSDIADPQTIGAEQVAAEYERLKATFEIKGTRTIEQLSFADRAAADAAAEKLKQGATFDQLVAEQGKTASDVLLGDYARDALPDVAIADAAFAVAKEGETTPVIEGALGPVIVRVSNIKEGRTKPLEEVRDELRASLAETAAIADINAVHDQFEDFRAGGSSLKEAAEQLKLNSVAVADIDSRGNDAKGEAVAGLPESASLVAEVFRSDIGLETNAISLGRTGYIWFEVTDIKAERDRTLDEVRERAIADWTAEQQRAALGKFAETLRQRVQDGTPLETVASELGLVVERKASVTRRTEDPVLGSAAVIAAFSGPVGTASSAAGGDPATQILLKVAAVRTEPTGMAQPGEEDQLANLANAAGDDILDQMVNALQSKYGVSINQTLAQQAIVR
ncbi:peptidylprolyl isomerase [Peteryoungia ipomoeae]|uniref:Parvulin-like PPIase n=1 Tax=Peteryoungia ipomoeae TaxID=1210932 RepID=A0A4S8P8L0_9HYPH|nr:peptidylprolyl isomerase [Peteryoungia ipomoeae]THV25242.1 peptidylprolyl isomerase [Peteryoungia ipomoeae]